MLEEKDGCNQQNIIFHPAAKGHRLLSISLLPDK
jgi:hypothetical protein